MRFGSALSRSAIGSLLAAFALVCPSISTAADPAAPAEYTQQDFYRELLAFNRDQFVHTYETAGHHDAKWDDDAKAALDLLAIYIAENSTESVASLPLYPDDRIGSRPLGDVAQKAIDLGCDEPMVFYAKAISLLNDMHARDARAYFEKAHAAVKPSACTPLSQCRIALRRRQFMLNPAAKASAWPAVEQLCVVAASEKFPSRAAQRETAQVIVQAFATLDNELQDEALKQFSKGKTVDRWIGYTVAADRQLALAWEARGTGWAKDMTPDQMQGFDAHLNHARAAAEIAYAARADLPEPAVILLKAACAQGNTDGAKEWFQRATKAQPDNAAAYAGIFMAAEPRWGGTTAQSLSVGQEALDGKRFDTSIPWEYVQAVLNITTDKYGGDKDLIKDPKIRDNIVQILQQYSDCAQKNYRKRFFQTCIAAVQDRNGDLKAARAALDSFDGDPSPQAFRIFNFNPPRAIENIYLSTFSDQDGIANFRRAASRHFYKNAANFLKDIFAKDKPQGRTLDILNRLEQGIDLLIDYNAGKTVSLIDETSRGFWESENDYPITPDGIHVGTGHGFVLQSRYVLPDRHYALHLKFEFEDPAATSGQVVSLAWGLEVNHVGWSIMVNANPGEITLQAPLTATTDDTKTIPRNIPAENTIDIVYLDDVPQVKLNGMPVAMDFGSKDATAKLKAPNRLYLSTNASVHFSEMTLHHLDAKP